VGGSDVMSDGVWWCREINGGIFDRMWL